MLTIWRTKSRNITHSWLLGVWLLFHDYGNGAISYLWNRNYVKWEFRYTFFSNFLRLLMTWKTIMFLKLEFVSFQRDASTCFFRLFLLLFLIVFRIFFQMFDLQFMFLIWTRFELEIQAWSKGNQLVNGRKKLLRVTAIFTL